MRRSLLAVLSILVTLLLVSTSCSAKNESGTSDKEGTSTTAEGGDSGGAVKFGDMKSPCGKGDYKVDQSESGGSTDKLLIGVANDRTAQIRPGLNKEIWDASNGFVKWCNDQGGIGGLPIQIVDLAGGLLEVESAMAKACNGVFMMAGGGFVQDNLEFSGKEGSDFFKCHLADIPAFAVSPEKADSNGEVQAVPNSAKLTPGVWLHDFSKLYPEPAAKMLEVWGDLPSMESIKNSSLAVQDSVDGVKNVGSMSYPPQGLPDWTPLAQQIIGSGAGSMHFVGEPTNLGALVKTLREQKWDGKLMVEANIYDPVYVESAGAENAAGTVIRSAFHPLEEAGKWPAVKQYEEIVNKNVDGAKIAYLGMQSFSAWLLFATAANDCASSNKGVLTRDCMLEAAASQDAWTGGGLHTATDPTLEGGVPPECGMLLTVSNDGKFERLFPEIGGKDDSADGFHCVKDSNVEVAANEGLAKIGADEPK